MYHGRINPSNGQIDWQEGKADLGYRVAAAGYSTYDQHVYALEERTLELLRIDAAGNVTELGVPSGLDPEMTFTAGVVSPSGRRFFVVGRDPVTGYDRVLFSITTGGQSSTPRAGRVAILNDFNAAVEDLAFDPVRGILYGYDRTTDKLVRLEWLSGLMVNYFSQSMAEVGSLGSLFFDRSGQLYGFGSTKGGGEESLFFEVQKTNGEAARLKEGPEGKSSDGCGCPYTIRISKQAVPFRVLPCTELLLHYEIVNHAGTAYSYVDFRDTLPDGFTITEIIRNPFLTLEASGVGSNILAITEMDLLLDTTRFTLRVAVGEDVSPGRYRSRANLSSFPRALGSVIYSDDPLTPLLLDATEVEVVAGEEVDLQPVIRPSCAGDGVTLSLDLPEAGYEWSTGETTPNIFVAQPGTYAVTVNTGCDTYYDSFQVESFPDLLAIDLGEDLELELGQTATLDENLLAAAGDYRYQWSAIGDEASLSCVACASPVVRPLTSTTYRLTVTDENGCTATDSIGVTVIPAEKVFIPNAFSPDGDGNNDVFYLQGAVGSARVAYLRVFDRWGNMLFASRDGQLDDPGHGWDGGTRGRKAPNGMYVWTAVLEFPDGRRKTFSGSVMLLAK